MNCPIPPDADAPAGAISKDAFYGGAFHLLQPAGRGFRAGHDALLLAACVAEDAAGQAVDMGSGSGAVALAAALRAPALQIVMAERNRTMAGLASDTLRLPENAASAPRLTARQLDLLAPRPVREAAGLRDGAFDLVLTNPPFHPATGRRSSDPLRDEARGMPDEAFLLRWIAVASALLRHGGHFLMIGRPDNLGQILPAAHNRFGAIAVRPLHAAPDAPATRILVSASRGSRLPLRMLPPLVMDAELRAAVSAGRFSVPMGL